MANRGRWIGQMSRAAAAGRSHNGIADGHRAVIAPKPRTNARSAPFAAHSRHGPAGNDDLTLVRARTQPATANTGTEAMPGRYHLAAENCDETALRVTSTADSGAIGEPRVVVGAFGMDHTAVDRNRAGVTVKAATDSGTVVTTSCGRDTVAENFNLAIRTRPASANACTQGASLRSDLRDAVNDDLPCVAIGVAADSSAVCSAGHVQARHSCI